MLKFSNNIIAHEFPDGFFWINKKDSLLKRKYSMLKCNKIENKIINIAGRGIEESLVYNELKNFSNKKIKKEINKLCKNEILTREKSSPIITGDKDHFYPTHVMIELTDYCNLNCMHCYKNGASKTPVFIEKNKIINAINELVSHGTLILEFTGGECTYHPNFFEIIDYCGRIKELKIIAIITNGTNLSEDLIKKLQPHNKKIVFSISLDSYEKELHDNFRGTNGAFDRVIKSLNLLKKYKFVVRASMSVFNKNLYHIEKTLKCAIANGARSFCWNPIMNLGNAKENCICYDFKTSKEAKKYMLYQRQLIRKYKKYIQTASKEQIRYLISEKSNCGLGTKSWVISPTGNVRPCILMPENYLKIGNIFYQQIEEIASNKLLFILCNIRSGSFRRKECRHCKNLMSCSFCVFKTLKNSNDMNSCKWKNLAEVKELMTFSCEKNISLENFCKQSFME